MTKGKIQKGVTMIEIVGVLGVLLVIATLSYRGVTRSRQQGMVERFLSRAAEIEKKLKNHVDFYRDDADVSNDRLLKATVLTPAECKGDSTCSAPKHIFNGAIVVKKEDHQVTITYTLVPKAACVQILTRPSRARKELFVNNVVIPSETGVAALAKNCTDMNTIMVLLDTKGAGTVSALSCPPGKTQCKNICMADTDTAGRKLQADCTYACASGMTFDTKSGRCLSSCASGYASCGGICMPAKNAKGVPLDTSTCLYQCPAETPEFDTDTKTCLACHENEVFNGYACVCKTGMVERLWSDGCKCPENSSWDNGSNTCVQDYTAAGHERIPAGKEGCDIIKSYLSDILFLKNYSTYNALNRYNEHVHEPTDFPGYEHTWILVGAGDTLFVYHDLTMEGPYPFCRVSIHQTATDHFRPYVNCEGCNLPTETCWVEGFTTETCPVITNADFETVKATFIQRFNAVAP